MAVATYTKTGNKAATPTKLDKKVFDVEVVNHQLLKDAYLTYRANGRSNFAKTKKRGEVRGGGRKPWPQKGTGNARAGSRRSPLWRGGGITFGPTGEQNYSRKLNASAKRQALRQALSLAAEEDRIKIIETFDCPNGKVRPTIDLLRKLQVEGTTLLVVSVKDELVARATRNLPKLKAMQANFVGVLDIINADTVIISKKALELITDRLSANDSAHGAKAPKGTDV